PQVYLNGEYLDRERARLPLDDRGFLFGDGVYEVCRVVRGKVFQAEAHWRRMHDGLRAISIDVDGHLDEQGLAGIYDGLIERNGLGEGEATVYVQVTRGAATRTHGFPPAGTPPTIYATATASRLPRAQREAGAAAITLPDIRWARCDVKSVNLLPNVLGKQRAIEAGAFEAIFIRDGVVTEGASSNLFVVLDGELRTYPLSNYILPGITRAIVLEQADRLGYRVSEMPVTQRELLDAEEIFATGTTTDVQPLVTVDGRPVGLGRPGPITRSLRGALEAEMAAVGAAECAAALSP